MMFQREKRTFFCSSSHDYNRDPAHKKEVLPFGSGSDGRLKTKIALLYGDKIPMDRSPAINRISLVMKFLIVSRFSRRKDYLSLFQRTCNFGSNLKNGLAV